MTAFAERAAVPLAASMILGWEERFCSPTMGGDLWKIDD